MLPVGLYTFVYHICLQAGVIYLALAKYNLYCFKISLNNQVLVSYPQGSVKTVWIRNCMTRKIYSVSSLTENSVVHGLKWNPEKLILAVTTLLLYFGLRKGHLQFIVNHF